ncbi:stalk domain-containing protein [Paenibacillus donghaensis]|uniref:Copper amine oxidase-like N-terminal domain-containing protein n=1 Tax=Paenibacillus donghaensis TaxID=414771 RepID=A0A2Z2KGK6_9BACL|nr:stalk domain-containing protein [Paenibacillus donghaensis]ASA19952.1 hypothetical protein B9T62_03515 [Paenibacillus donghaensis]
MGKKSIRQFAQTTVAGVLAGFILLQPVAAVHAAQGDDKLLTEVSSLDAGQQSAYAIQADGSAWAWGGGTGSIGNGATTPAYTPVRMQLDQVQQISGGYRHSLQLKTDGTVWAVGGNEHGQLGDGKVTAAITTRPVQVQGLADVRSVAAGDNHSLALLKDGSVWGWGGNDAGQLGDSSRVHALQPVQIKGLTGIKAISAGNLISAVLDSEGEVTVFGAEQSQGKVPPAIRKPSVVEGNGTYTALEVDQLYGAALRADGTVWVWKNQAMAEPYALKPLVPYEVKGLKDVVSISIDAAVQADGTVWQWETQWQDGLRLKQVAGITNAAAVSSSGRNHYVLLKDGYVMSWGANEYGQTGLGVLDFEITEPQRVKKSISVFIDGQEKGLAMPPLLLKSSTYVPLRGVFEQMGLKLDWDVKTRSVRVNGPQVKIVLNSVTGVTTLNGVAVPTQEKAVFVNQSVYVPLRLISELLGAEVRWDAAAYAVRIDSK